MGLRLRRSGRIFQSIGMETNAWTSVGAPGTGIRFGQSSNGDARFLVGAAILVVISLLVLLLP